MNGHGEEVLNPDQYVAVQHQQHEEKNSLRWYMRW